MTNDHQFLILFSFLNAGIVIYTAAIWFGFARKPKKIERSGIIAEMLYVILDLLPVPGWGSPADWTGPWRVLTIANVVVILACGVSLLLLKGDDGPAVIERKVHVEWVNGVIVLLLVVAGLFLAYWASFGPGSHGNVYIFVAAWAVALVIGLGFLLHWRRAADKAHGLRQKG